ncbi:MAG: VOC family protein [Lachnospiraceae bacterium]|nr:VOC family protein [Lachnospiraceae bacterium]
MSKLLHVNMNAKDWKKLAAFYEEVFGCVQAPPAKEITGDYAAELTGLQGAEIHGMTMIFPDDPNGAQLEIFQYNIQDDSASGAINMTGLGHIAVDVEDIEETTKKLLAAGGAYVGRQIHRTYVDKPDLFIHYVRDCEGNIIELMQRKAES